MPSKEKEARKPALAGPRETHTNRISKSKLAGITSAKLLLRQFGDQQNIKESASLSPWRSALQQRGRLRTLGTCALPLKFPTILLV